MRNGSRSLATGRISRVGFASSTTLRWGSPRSRPSSGSTDGHPDELQRCGRRAGPNGAPTRLKSTIARIHGRRHAFASRAGQKLTRDPLGHLIAMAASADDFGPAGALAALRGEAESHDTARLNGTGIRPAFRRLSRACRNLWLMGRGQSRENTRTLLPWVANGCRDPKMVRRGSTVRVRQRA